jgi:hypothetical protein
MAPYYEVLGKDISIINAPLSDVSSERKLSPGEKVVLLSASSFYNQKVKGSVVAQILSDNKAKVSITTGSRDYIPGSPILHSTEENTIWCGPIFSECGDDNHERKAVQKENSFITRRQTIFSNGFKRVEWRKE